MNRLFEKYKSSNVVMRASFWFMFCGILQKGVAMLTTPIFSRLLTTEQYGQYSLYTSWLSILTIFCTLRLEKAVFNKGMSKYPDDRDTYTSSMQLATNILTLCSFGIYLFFRSQINAITELGTAVTCGMFLELMFNPAMSFYNLRKRYDYKYVSVVVITISYTVLNALLGVVAVLLSDESDRGIARIATCICVATLFGLGCYIYNCCRSRFKIKFKYITFAIKFNIPLIPHYFSSYILEQSDRLMIQKMVSTSKVGIYSVAYNIGLVMKIVSDSLHSAITPWQYEKMRKHEYEDVNKTIFPILLAALFSLVLFIGFAPEAMWILADKEYFEAVYAIPPVAASVFFIMCYGIYSNAEFYFNANKFSSFCTMFGAVVNVILNFIGIKLFGYIAAAYTTLICYTIYAYAHFIYANSVAKKIEEKRIFPLKPLLIMSILIYAVVIVMSLLYSHTVIRYGLIAIVTIWLFCKRRMIIEVLQKIKKK